ncbi:MAG: hypothetical protein ACJAZP_002741 [Psychromonas sp.]|jgi:hypothetical protein|uniref:hypothetical protein n=1 Tax=Psychromonas sp. TaxID=1884585 RepID=UPI0039E435AC
MNKYILLLSTSFLTLPVMANVSCNDLLKADSNNGVSLITDAISDMGYMDAAKFGKKFAGLNLEDQGKVVAKSTILCTAASGEEQLAKVLKSSIK